MDKVDLKIIDKAKDNFINEKHYDEFCSYLGSIISQIKCGIINQKNYLKEEIKPRSK